MASVVSQGNCTGTSVAFEVMLSPKVENARKPRLTPLKGKESFNIQLLVEKQLAAEKRRKSIEGEVLAKAASRSEHVVQVQQNKLLTVAEKSRMAEEKLKQKMCTHSENKEAQIKALYSRLHAKEQHIKEVQANLREIIASFSKKAEEKIQQKEAVSKENLELHRKAQMERWQAHEKRIQEVLASLQESIEKQSKIAEVNLQQKMETTTEKREALIRSLQERLQFKSQKIEQARQLVDALVQEQSKVCKQKLQQKLEQSEEKRNALLRALQERLEAHDKHVEEVYHQVKTQRAEKAQG